MQIANNTVGLPRYAYQDYTRKKRWIALDLFGLLAMVWIATDCYCGQGYILINFL